MVLLIVRRRRLSTFALNRYSSLSSYSIILNFLLEKLDIVPPCKLPDGWMDERCFRPLLCTVKAELGRGQPGLMR